MSDRANPWSAAGQQAMQTTAASEVRPEKFAPGEPFCGKCGYALKGLTSSSACPECGTPFVVGLVRGARRVKGGYRFRSAAELWGLPLVHVAFGPDEKSVRGKAKGIIAIGDQATGFIAVGGVAFGGVTVGGVGIGVASVGGCSVGLLSALGGSSLSGGLAAGGMAIGACAAGGMAIGVVARGGQAVGMYTISGRGVSQGAPEVFRLLAPLMGSSNGFIDFTAFLMAFLIPAGLATLVGIVCLWRYRAFAKATSL